MGGEVHIDIYDDRVELVSPGDMLDGTQIQDRDISKVPSMRRNPVIADVFTWGATWRSSRSLRT